MNFKGKFIIVSFATLLLLFNFNDLFAQHDNISFEHFTNDNGLSAPVTEIIQDHLGFLWLGTTDGLNRFDGKNFVVYRNIQGDTTSLANNIINDLCVDSKDRIWLATNGGLCYYNFSDDAFHQIDYSDTLEKIDRHRVHAVTSGTNGEIWFATKTLLHLWQENQTIKTFSIPDNDNFTIKYIYSDNKNHIWMGTSDRVIVFNKNNLTFIQKKISSPFSENKKLSVTVHPIIYYNGDTLLVGSWYAGMQKIFLSGDSIKSIPIIDLAGSDLRQNIVTGIANGEASEWWVGTYGAGLYIYDSGENNFIKSFHNNPSDAKSLSNDYINKIYKDASGIIWIGTASGLDKYDPLKDQFRTISIPASTNEFSVYRLPSSIIRDKYNPQWLWITVSGAGLYHYNSVSGIFKLYSNDPKNHPRYLITIFMLFIMMTETEPGLDQEPVFTCLTKRLKNFMVRFFKEILFRFGVNKILQDNQGRFWFATYSNGILLL